MADLQGTTSGKICYLIRNSKPAYFVFGVLAAIVYTFIYAIIFLPLSFINIVKANLDGEYLEKDCYGRVDNFARGDTFSRKHLYR